MGGSHKFSTTQHPEQLQTAIETLRTEYDPDSRIDAVADNWAYIWLPTIEFIEAKYPAPYKRGLWVRIPIQFPNANPHGLVTKEPITPLDGHAVKGHNPGHETCRPVAGLGGNHYYSWTWSGELGAGPQLRSPRDILKIVPWIERRIRNA